MKASPLFVFRNLAPTAGWRRTKQRAQKNRCYLWASGP